MDIGEVLFCVFMFLFEHVWSIKNLLCGKKNINFLAGLTREISGGGSILPAQVANKSTGFTIINHNIDSLYTGAKEN